MSLPIKPITVPVAPDISGTITAPRTTAAPNQEGSFGDVLSAAIQNVETAVSGADQASQNFISGGNQELHSTILAAQNAEIDFQMLMQVRDKVVSAYQEIMRMQI